MEIGEKVFYKPLDGENQIVKIIDVKEDWTPFPFRKGGTALKICIIETKDGTVKKVDTFRDGCTFESKDCLQVQINNYKQEILEIEEKIKKAEGQIEILDLENSK